MIDVERMIDDDWSYMHPDAPEPELSDEDVFGAD